MPSIYVIHEKNAGTNYNITCLEHLGIVPLFLV